MKTVLVCLSLMLSDTVLAQNVLNKTGNPTATPIVAFSVRQLSSAYTGKCMLVRRSSDNDSMQIGFTPAGDLDTATLLTFVGSNSGYVRTWYDQSGNGLNAVQYTNADQPTIAVNGKINRDNGKPSVYTNGALGFLYYQPVTQLNGTTTATRMEVCRNRSNNFAIIEGLGYYQLDLQLFTSPYYVMYQYEDGNITVSGATMPNDTTLMSVNSVRIQGNCQLYVNTISQGTPNTSTLLAFSAPDTGFIGERLDNVGSEPGAFSETMLFASALSNSDRQAINYNENWYYSLGFAPCSSTTDTLTPNGTTTKALYACTVGTGPSWAYYYDPANPLKLLFGIEKDPGNTGANSTFVADSINLTTGSNPDAAGYGYGSLQGGIFSIGRYWNVYTHTPLTSPVNIRFFFNPADTAYIYNATLTFKTDGGFANMSDLTWFKTVGDPYAFDSLTANPIVTVKGPYVNLTPIYGTLSGTTIYAEFDGVTSFSGGTGVYIVSNGPVTLPVIISSFSGQCANNKVLLTWTTQSESNSLQFDIQRSADGSTWGQIGQVSAAGNSSHPTSYNFTDINPLGNPNNNYYRLRLVDEDGQDVYSGVVLVNSCNSTGAAPQLFKVVPNPFGSSMEITCTIPNDGPVEVQVQDMTGATLLRQEYTATRGNNVFNLTNLNNLAKGTYVVLVVQKSVVGIGKVIKE